MALTLLTKPLTFSINFIKETMIPARGPQMVATSLQKGLNELNISYRLNPKYLTETVCVLQNTKALLYSIQQKKLGKIKTLLAGPNITVTPKDENNILENSLIDKIIVPSQWVKNFYSSLSPIIKDKIYIWAAGVDDPEEPLPINKRDTVLIYQKNGSIEMLDRLVKSVKLQSYKVDLITYGKYKQEDYFAKLSKTKLAIFLTQSESQGIAQQEAWIRDVPTLVWNPGKWQYNEYIWTDEKISSPYLTEKCGMFFSSFDEFEPKLDKMQENLVSFTPREYALENFTHKKSAETFLKIINYQF